MEIRAATTEDLGDIDAALGEVWSEKLLRPVAERYIEDAQRALWVGTDAGGAVSGFVSAFAAEMANGRTWIVDMLAVRPAFQGRGIGRALVRAALVSATALGLERSRALVRVDNEASQRCFAAAGYDGEGAARQMLFWPPQERSTEGIAELHLLSVDALVYRGLWLDGLESAERAVQRRAIASACALAAREGRDVVSALVAVDRLDALASDVRAAAQMQGVYRWWQRSIGVVDPGRSNDAS